MLCSSTVNRRLATTRTSATSADVQLVCTLSTAAGHDMQQHPETAARVAVLAQLDLLQHPRETLLQPPAAAEISSQLETVLKLVHPAGYLARLQEICSSLQAPTMIDDSTYIAPGSYAACCEVGASTSSSCTRCPPSSRPHPTTCAVRSTCLSLCLRLSVSLLRRPQQCLM